MLKWCPGFRHACKSRQRCSSPCLSRELAVVQIHRQARAVLPGSVRGQVGGEEIRRMWRMPMEMKAEPQPCCKTPLAELFPVQGEDLALLGLGEGASACRPGWQRGG